MKRSHFNLKDGLFWSAVLHAVALLLLAGVFGSLFPKPEAKVLKVQLVSAAQLASKKAPEKEKPKTEAPKAKLDEIKTQASAAPKEAPKKPAKSQPKLKTQAPKVKAPEIKKPEPKEKPKPKPKEADKKATQKTENEKEKAKPRPPKLDKTPDKAKALRSQNPKAKTVADADDFLAALDFVKDLEKSQPKEKPVEEQPTETEIESNDELTLADQSEIAFLQKHIRKYWILPPGVENAENMVASVELTVKQDGSIGRLRILQSSGHPFFDNALLRAIRKAVPLPIPQGKYDVFRELELHFAGK
ncbi:MAG: TonB family protein [Alphaproteobacteria bacterium]|nr:TonB family protein [Alphaproteobacteria bacterium]MDD9920517.1 TonB family protein [Alphaproteobacteria bacterium]